MSNNFTIETVKCMRLSDEAWAKLGQAQRFFNELYNDMGGEDSLISVRKLCYTIYESIEELRLLFDEEDDLFKMSILKDENK